MPPPTMTTRPVLRASVVTGASLGEPTVLTETRVLESFCPFEVVCTVDDRTLRCLMYMRAATKAVPAAMARTMRRCSDNILCQDADCLEDLAVASDLDGLAGVKQERTPRVVRRRFVRRAHRPHRHAARGGHISIRTTF